MSGSPITAPWYVCVVCPDATGGVGVAEGGNGEVDALGELGSDEPPPPPPQAASVARIVAAPRAHRTTGVFISSGW